MREVNVICGNDSLREVRGDELRLSLDGPSKNVALRISDLTRAMVRNLPAAVADLVEVAAYVYAADLATSRGGPVSEGMGTAWRRAFRLVIPVREPDHWNAPSTRLALSNALSFLSDEDFDFEFVAKAGAAESPEYLDLGTKTGIAFKADEAVLFSGGLDSLAGTIQELATTKKKIVLVSHRPSTKIFEHQRKLVDHLRNAFPNRLLHIPVLAHREEPLEVKEFTQRTRSFLYAALAGALAHLAGLSEAYFFENGIVSMNLPIAAQVVGSRATRTTHPFAMLHLGRALSQILSAKFHLSNPFLWATKRDIVQKVVQAGFGELIAQSVSCSHVREMTKAHTHCGRCSQCIDRRFGVLSAGAASYDPHSHYAVDLLEGERDAGIDRTMAEAFVRSRIEMSKMSDSDFLSRYAAEIAMICGGIESLTPSETARRVIELHRQHGAEVAGVVERAIADHSGDLVRGSLSPSSIIMMSISPSPANLPNGAAFAPQVHGQLKRPVSPKKHSRTKPVRSRADEAIHVLYPAGVPSQTELSNGMLCGAVTAWFKKTGKREVSDDTILRAAGRRN
jgi:7-cyano-7-deazaguanine synthase in queuosine biosynthesis